MVNRECQPAAATRRWLPDLRRCCGCRKWQGAPRTPLLQGVASLSVFNATRGQVQYKSDRLVWQPQFMEWCRTGGNLLLQYAFEQRCVIQTDSQLSSSLQAGHLSHTDRPMHALHLNAAALDKNPTWLDLIKCRNALILGKRIRVRVSRNLRHFHARR